MSSHYARTIATMTDLDPDRIEDAMRNRYRTLCHLTRDQFRDFVAECEQVERAIPGFFGRPT